MRCFVAIELSPELRRPLVQILQRLPRTAGVRWVTEEQLHVTLKFLGELAESQLPAVREIVRTVSAQFAPFPVRLGPLGAFPTARSPRVLWAGLEDGTGTSARWVAAADPRFAELGCEPEARPFTPHITLGRSKSPDGTSAMRQALATLGNPPALEMNVRELVVFESRLTPGGAQYAPLYRAGLGSTGNANGTSL